MVETEGQVSGVSDLDLSVPDDRPLGYLMEAEDSHFGGVHDGSGEEASDRSHVRDGEGRATDLVKGELSAPGLVGELFDLSGKLEYVLPVDVSDDGDDKALFRVSGYADIVVFLQDNVPRLVVERGVNVGELFRRRDEGLENEGDVGKVDPSLLRAPLERLSKQDELRHVGFVDVGHLGGRLE